jgi:hypothetical protein
MLIDLYHRWLFEVWDAGNYSVADEVGRAPHRPQSIPGSTHGTGR